MTTLLTVIKTLSIIIKICCILLILLNTCSFILKFCSNSDFSFDIAIIIMCIVMFGAVAIINKETQNELTENISENSATITQINDNDFQTDKSKNKFDANNAFK